MLRWDPHECLLEQIVGKVVVGNPAANEPTQVRTQERPDRIGGGLGRHQGPRRSGYWEQAQVDDDAMAFVAPSGTGGALQQAALSSQQSGLSAQQTF